MYIRTFAVACCTALLLPMTSFAHERQLFSVGGTEYLFVVGSLGEPVVVDDKTGVELRVKLADPLDKTNASAPSAMPATGLEKALQVEIIAGEKKKAFDLTPAFGEPGTYRTLFFPTVETTLTYRFFGEIDTIPFDVSFTCNPAGHVAAPEDRTETPISEGVVRLYKAGQFGCPQAKGPLGFPEASLTMLDLHEDADQHMGAMMADIDARDAKTNSALGIGFLALVLSAAALWKSAQKPML